MCRRIKSFTYSETSDTNENVAYLMRFHVHFNCRINCMQPLNHNILFVRQTKDEEIGGVHGMLAFTQTDAFRALNVGFALDEGIASASDVYPVFYAERCAWCE